MSLYFEKQTKESFTISRDLQLQFTPPFEFYTKTFPLPNSQEGYIILFFKKKFKTSHIFTKNKNSILAQIIAKCSSGVPLTISSHTLQLLPSSTLNTSNSHCEEVIHEIKSIQGLTLKPQQEISFLYKIFQPPMELKWDFNIQYVHTRSDLSKGIFKLFLKKFKKELIIYFSNFKKFFFSTCNWLPKSIFFFC